MKLAISDGVVITFGEQDAFYEDINGAVSHNIDLSVLKYLIRSFVGFGFGVVLVMVDVCGGLRTI